MNNIDITAEITRLAADPEFAHLDQNGNLYDVTFAAKNIRAQLKKAFQGVKFSVRKRGAGCVYVSWIDGPRVAEVEQITNRYRAGHFCGMEDIFNYEKTAWNQLFGNVDYIICQREHSAAAIERAIDAAFNRYDLAAAGIQRPSVAEYENGSLWRIETPTGGRNLQQLIRELAS